MKKQYNKRLMLGNRKKFRIKKYKIRKMLSKMTRKNQKPSYMEEGFQMMTIKGLLVLDGDWV